MNLKKLLQTHMKKQDIPQLQSRILNEIGVVYRSKSVRFGIRKLALQLSTVLFLLTAMILLGYQEVSGDLYAFEGYDEAMITATTTAYTYYSMDVDNQALALASSHESVIVEELPYIVRYFRVFESIITAQREYKLSKTTVDNTSDYTFETTDLLNQTYNHKMVINKKMKTERKDEFAFEGVFNDTFHIQGETMLLNDDTHRLDVTIQMATYQFDFTFEERSNTYTLSFIQDEQTLTTLTYQVIYDAYNIPTLHMTYDRDDIHADLYISRSFRLRAFVISYDIFNTTSYQGDMTLSYVIGSGYLIQVSPEDGEPFDKMIERPICCTHMMM